MNKASLLAEILRLPQDERRDLLSEAWESLPDEEFSPLTAQESAEIDRRIAEHDRDPSRAIPWEKVIADLQSRYR